MSFDVTQPTSTTADEGFDEPPFTEDGDADSFSTSRYERNSGSLPHLGSDPEWAPPGSEFVATIVEDEPRGWLRRLWA